MHHNSMSSSSFDAQMAEFRARHRDARPAPAPRDVDADADAVLARRLQGMNLISK